MGQALALMWRDATEAPLLMALIAVPALIAMPRLGRSPLPTMCVAVLSTQLVAWFLWYLGGSSNLGLFWSLIPFVLAFVFGLALAIGSWIYPRRQTALNE
jgi:hypothetical protein